MKLRLVLCAFVCLFVLGAKGEGRVVGDCGFFTLVSLMWLLYNTLFSVYLKFR